MSIASKNLLFLPREASLAHTDSGSSTETTLASTTFSVDPTATEEAGCARNNWPADYSLQGEPVINPARFNLPVCFHHSIIWPQMLLNFYCTNDLSLCQTLL